jgi:hypothetical protein
VQVMVCKSSFHPKCELPHCCIDEYELAACTIGTKRELTSGVNPAPPEQAPVQLPASTQLAVQLMGQGMVLLQGVDSRVVPLMTGQPFPPAAGAHIGTQDVTASTPRHHHAAHHYSTACAATLACNHATKGQCEQSVHCR